MRMREGSLGTTSRPLVPFLHLPCPPTKFSTPNQDPSRWHEIALSSLPWWCPHVLSQSQRGVGRGWRGGAASSSQCMEVVDAEMCLTNRHTRATAAPSSVAAWTELPPHDSCRWRAKLVRIGNWALAIIITKKPFPLTETRELKKERGRERLTLRFPLLSIEE